MANAPGSYDSIQQVPLAVEFGWRGNNKTAAQTDAWAKNVFVEKDADQVFSVKRPGLSTAGSIVPSGFGNLQIQGLTVEQRNTATAIAIANDHYMYLLTGTANNPIVGTVVGGYALTLATGQSAGSWYCSVPVTTGAINVASIPLFAIFQTPWGIVTGRWAYNAGAHLFYQNFTTTNSPSYAGVGGPAPLVPGLGALDSTWYVMDVLGHIWASGIGAPESWPALNYVNIDVAIGPPVALAQLGSYIIAFGRNGTQLWYDAAISPGAPIAAVQGGLFLQGMAQIAPFSIAKGEKSLLWLGTSGEGALVVFQLSGTQIDKVSTPAVERYLSAICSGITIPTELASSVSIRGSLFKVSGHEFYMLSVITPGAASVGTGGATLVYDLTTHNWVVWTQQTALAYGEGAMRAWQVLSMPAGVNYFPDMTSGDVAVMSDTVYQDEGQNINVLVQTENYNWGNQRTKLIAATFPLLDTVASTVMLTWTDDDYATFIPAQTINTATSRKSLVRCGSTVQRAWKLTHADNTPMRFYALEVEVLPGAL